MKAKLNFEKHGVRFEEAMTVFEDGDAITIFDYSHSSEEDRFVNLGRSKNGTVLSVVFTDRDDRIRLIHARKASKEERRFYEENG